MKRIATALIAAALATSAVPAFATPVCLDSLYVDSTTVPDSHHIVFRMKDGTKWINTLKTNCPGLRFNGFSYEPFADRQICENTQIIHVIDDHSVCALGPFEKVPPKS